MKSLLYTLAALLCLCPILHAQIPAVDTAEAIRRGPMVTHSGMGIRDADESAIIRANSPPADDNNRWHITLFTQEGCPPCDRLKADFAKSKELLAFVAAPEGSVPWAHFNIYNSSDATQKWRIEPYHITAFPTVVIQPPRDWSWGDPRTVIAKLEGYDGDSKKMASRISSPVRLFAQVQARHGYPKPPQPIKAGVSEDGSVTNVSFNVGAGQAPGDSRTPPFATPPVVDPFRPSTYPVPGGDFGPPSAPTPLTFEQIVATVPDATSDFVLSQLKAKATDPVAVKLAWLDAKTPKQPEPVTPPPAPVPLTFEQVKELMPLEDSTVILAVVEAKPTTSGQAIALASEVKKKLTETPPAPSNLTDFLGSLVSSAMSQILGPKMAVVLLAILVLIKILAYIAPLTKTKADDNALAVLQAANNALTKSPAKDPSSTP